jgi:hypothetical protein
LSTHTYYQAIHEASPLFLRLRDDPPFHLLFGQLMLLGPGPFFWSHLETDEIEDVLDWMAGERHSSLNTTTSSHDSTRLLPGRGFRPRSPEDLG